MKHLAYSSSVFLLLTAWTVGVEGSDETLKPGDSAGAFQVQDCTGPAKDSGKLCYR